MRDSWKFRKRIGGLEKETLHRKVQGRKNKKRNIREERHALNEQENVNRDVSSEKVFETFKNKLLSVTKGVVEI